MDDLTRRWDRFSLSGLEAKGVPLSSKGTNRGGTIAGWFLTRRRINIEAIAKTFRPLWRAAKGFTLRDMGENKVLFTFQDSIDAERVIQNGPWSYDRSLVICKRVEANIPITEIKFTHSLFWVQIHDLPVLSLNKEVSETIGRTLGRVEFAPDSIEDRGGGPCMRIRVLVDITKPLCRGRKILMDNNQERWVSFKYERLPNFCYWCGRVDHGDKDCAIWLANPDTLHQSDQQFGPWMRASVDNGSRRTAVTVDGHTTENHDSTESNTHPPEDEVQPQEPMDFQENYVPPMNPSERDHILPPNFDHIQLNRIEREARFEAELDSIDTAFGLGTQTQDHPHTTLEKIAHLTGVLAESSQQPNSQENNELDVLIIDKPPSKQSENMISVQQEVTVISGVQQTNSRPTETLSDSQANTKRSTWKKGARHTPSATIDHTYPMETKGVSKRTRVLEDDVDPSDTLRNKKRNTEKEVSVRELHEVVKHEDPKVVFLMETRLELKNVESLRVKSGMQSSMVVERIGTGGGLALLWRDEVQIVVHSHSIAHIDITIRIRGYRDWHFTGFYGNLETSKRDDSWTLLRRLHRNDDLPWLVMGDFNELLDCSEKTGRLERHWYQIESFRQALSDCALADMGFQGNKFTWWNGRYGTDCVYERLDRGCCTTDWKTLFPNAQIRHVPFSNSDHAALVLNLNLSLPRNNTPFKRFRFENVWLQMDGCEEVIQAAWTQPQSGHLMYQVTRKVKQKVTPLMNNDLCKIFTGEEIRTALFQMHPTKAPGPDGMNVLFYQKFWHIVGPDVTNAILDFFKTGHLLKSVNYTHISLIPKTKSPDVMTQFRPISLCNVLHKIISKVLANQLKKVLIHVISENQSAFVLGRLITDNILVAFEALHYLKTKRHGKTAHMVVKLDMSKAYDRVEWGFIRIMMLKMGFNESSGQLRGLSICRGGPIISHLFFADDSLLFCRATVAESQALTAILDIYEKASGQKLNYEKTSLFFSSNTHPDMHHAICTELQTTSTGDLGKYLGLPPIIGRRKKQAFMEIKHKVAKKLQGWKGKLLSQVGREILIKSVAQAIPVFTMSCFQLLDSLCKEINSMVGRFWWGQKETKRKIHWQKWSSLCRKKIDGGIGFRDLATFNQALLAKQEAEIPSHSSFTWRSLAQARHIIRLGTRWRIGTGTQVQIWYDKWLNTCPPYMVLSPRQILPEHATVSDLIDHETSQWKSQLIDTIFTPHEASKIKSIPLGSLMRDTLVWLGTPTGQFSTRSAYMMQIKAKESMSGSQSNPSRKHIFWKGIWGVSVPHKVKVFMWRACNSTLPTKTNLFKRGVVSSCSCMVCHEEAEIVLHTLWDCEYAREVLCNSKLGSVCNFSTPSSWCDVVEQVLSRQSNSEIAIFFTIAWMIWGNRNNKWLQQSDHTGALLAASSEETSNTGDGLSMAASTLIKALQFGEESGFHRLMVEFTHP
uniref:Reverse transcriptase domain-containing protein n=1 Tax=Fagus sylvatica TaxID=28930 RepID=A0A2N9GDA6_FAGSY